MGRKRVSRKARWGPIRPVLQIIVLAVGKSLRLTPVVSYPEPFCLNPVTFCYMQAGGISKLIFFAYVLGRSPTRE